jgi:ribosome assembly protein 4
MATLLPPKRQKLHNGLPEPESEQQAPAYNVVVQFVSEDDGQPLGPAVSLPATVSTEGLQTLVNNLKSQVCCYL